MFSFKFSSNIVGERHNPCCNLLQYQRFTTITLLQNDNVIHFYSTRTLSESDIIHALF